MYLKKSLIPAVLTRTIINLCFSKTGTRTRTEKNKRFQIPGLHLGTHADY